MFIPAQARGALHLLGLVPGLIGIGATSTAAQSIEDRYWSSGFHRAGIIGGQGWPQIKAMIEFDNSLVMGGDFAAAGSAVSPGVARWEA
ncbi:MAG TPA: hypothetical protein VFD07_12965 [Candidatus Krumholzibacteria bacterium]|nr:hypothetical protein [Candidatus Krumholzibacteria bacterium]